MEVYSPVFSQLVGRRCPILLIGPPGIGKTAVMEQVAAECKVGLVAYTITHHTRQSAVGLPKIVTRNYGGMETNITGGATGGAGTGGPGGRTGCGQPESRTGPQGGRGTGTGEGAAAPA